MEYSNICAVERISRAIRDIYEQYGYEKFAMSKFEEYDFYTRFRDFLSDAQILTFSDLSGRLMALKPDITMSIVKNTHATARNPERLYYSESVYRADKSSREFREITQIGIEYIGEVNLYTQAEVITLALKSLEQIDQSYVLDIGHAGFMNELLTPLPKNTARTVAACIEQKNSHELELALKNINIPKQTHDALLGIINLRGDFIEALETIQPFVTGEKLKRAYDELNALADIFRDKRDVLRLDFSFTGNSKYYNGILLRGYAQSIPKRVLSGGRYDPLVARMAKSELGAIGFAVYFDEIERAKKSKEPKRFDAIALYDDQTDMKKLHGFVEKLIAQGKRVYCAKSMPACSPCAEVYTDFEEREC